MQKALLVSLMKFLLGLFLLRLEILWVGGVLECRQNRHGLLPCTLKFGSVVQQSGLLLSGVGIRREFQCGIVAS